MAPFPISIATASASCLMAFAASCFA
jgi:hypothetical protein